MLTVTKAALDRLSRGLAQKGAAEGTALRVTRTDRGWRLNLDRVRPADTMIAHDGRNVLLLDDLASEALVHRTLDVRKTTAGARLRLRKAPDERN